MVSRSVQPCAFVPLQGGDGEHTLPLANGAVTIAYDQDQPIDPAALAGVLDQPEQEAWSGVTIGGREFGLWLRLATVETGTCPIAAQPSAVDSGLATPAIPARTPAIIDGSSLAYLTLRPTPDGGGHARRHELGAIGHGSGDIASRFIDQIRAWDRDRTAIPAITVIPTGTSVDSPPGAPTIEKRHIRMIFT